MRSIVAFILVIALAANGLIMLAVPVDWYAMVPNVSETGWFNAHFVRDIGVAYLVAGAALTSFALDRAARPAALAGAAFLALHALVHLWDAAAGRAHAHALLVDLPSVFLPPALAIWLAWPRPNSNKENSHDQMVPAATNRRL